MKQQVQEALKNHFRPEFLNRIDEVIVFHELTMDEVVEIVELLIRRVRDQLEGQGIGLELTLAAKRFVAAEGLRARARRTTSASCHPAARRGPALGEDPLEGIPGGRDGHRRRGGRRARLPGHRGLRASGRRARRGRRRLLSLVAGP